MGELRLVVIPRWGGTPRDDFYHWLGMSLGDLDPVPFSELVIPEMPERDAPRVETWTAIVRAAMGETPEERARTVVLGHSVGARAALYALSRLPRGERIAGLLVVAGWWTLDEPWPAAREWLDTPLDLAAAAAATQRTTVLLSDGDPYTRDYATNARDWERHMGARTVLVPGAEHFNGASQPAILQAIRDDYGG